MSDVEARNHPTKDDSDYNFFVLLFVYEATNQVVAIDGMCLCGRLMLCLVAL